MASKIALVTGGSRGLGKNMALRLAEKGNDVIITYNTKEAEANTVVTEIEKMGQKAVALQFDIAQIKSFDAFTEKVLKTLKEKWSTDKFDFLINNAGVGATIMFAQVTEDDFDRLVNINFKGVYFSTQKLLPHINNNGTIINLSSGSTRFVIPGYSVYASMKGAIEVFTKYLSKDLGARGITVNVLAPGATETDFNNALLRSNPERKAFIASQTPLGRIGQADDIGGIVAFLCSDDAHWINGQRIEASGGIN